ncbi:FeoB-associated Cys-rich membrane protein [Agathobaculum sp. Marseille-P7918]|uniref:FeoB-associated Cys-rich membrane protein n=1 Tax=Agathobaculum sp. Marseille-P7918 TaxID=2479843 RepID=UPI00356B5F66
MSTLIVGLLVALLVFFAARSVVRQSKTGGCSGCGGGCAGCSGSCGCHVATSPEQHDK